MTSPVLRIEGLRKTFGARRDPIVAVEGLDLVLPRGGSVAIVGESGSGKTTTARCIVGLERPTSGRIEVAGRLRPDRTPSARERRRRAREIQMVFQDPYSSLNPRRTVTDVLQQAIQLAERGSAAEPASGTASSRTTGVSQLMGLVELPAALADSRPRQLSGGQRQRLAIARALASGAEVLVLDEAISALDVSVQAQILNLLADVREARGLSLLFISHDLAAVRQVADDIVVMQKGIVVERGTADEVLTAPTHPYTRRLLESVPRPGWDPLRAVQPMKEESR